MRDTHTKKHHMPVKTIIVGFLCLCLGFGLGYIVFYTPEVTVKTVKETVDNKTLRQVYRILKNNFLDTSSKSLSDRMIKGLTDGVDDPYTSYMTKSEYEDYDESLNGRYVGIGISYLKTKKGALVTEAFKNGPAKKAGIAAGDIITAVDGVDLKGKSTEKMQEMIRGETGTLVNFTYLHLGKEKNVHITRKNTQSAVESETGIINKKVYGLLHLSSFSDDSATYVKKALQSFVRQKVDTLIIDVRDNGGGYVNAAEDILSLFNKKGTVLYSVKDKSGKNVKATSSGRQVFSFKHNYILVNHNTASASEILAGSLRELNGFKLVGEKTYGKGTMQIEQPLSNGGVLKYTYARWYSAKGKSVNKKGWQPDIAVKMLNTDELKLDTITKNYHSGDLNDHVKAMQLMLKSLNYQIDRTDGYFSAKTKSMLKRYQRKRKIGGKGVYNKKTNFYLLYDYLQSTFNKEYDPAFKKVKSLMEGEK